MKWLFKTRWKDEDYTYSIFSVLLGFMLILSFPFAILMHGLRHETPPHINDKQPYTQGNLNTTYQSDSVTTKKYQFKSYSPITEHQKNHVKEKR